MKRTTILVAATLGLAACEGPNRHASPDPLGDAFRKRAQEEGLNRTETEGKRLFAHYCVTCHGERGQGDGQNAYNLDPKPPDFRQSLSAHRPSYWREIVEGGSAAVGRTPLCPPWGRALSARDIDALIAYLVALQRPASAAPRPAPGGAVSR